MSFDLDISAHEEAYWDNLPLSPTAKDRIKQFVADVTDAFRLDPVNRPKPDAPYFKIEYILWDRWGDRRMHRIDLYVRDDRAEFGVLFVTYVEHH